MLNKSHVLKQAILNTAEIICKFSPILPMDEVMKVNLNKLTTSHHGDLWPPVRIASKEPEMIRTEQLRSERVRLTSGSQWIHWK